MVNQCRSITSGSAVEGKGLNFDLKKKGMPVEIIEELGGGSCELSVAGENDDTSIESIDLNDSRVDRKEEAFYYSIERILKERREVQFRRVHDTMYCWVLLDSKNKKVGYETELTALIMKRFVEYSTTN